MLYESLPPVWKGSDDSSQVLAETEKRFEEAKRAHAEPERLRLEELEKADSTYPQVRRAWLLSMWPKGVTLDEDVMALDTLVEQVDAQNAEIESQVNALTDLLQDGLKNPPVASETDSYRAGDLPGSRATSNQS